MSREMKMEFYRELKNWGDNAAFIAEDGDRLTYDELDALCADLERYVVPRSLAIVFCENSIACVSGYIGFLYNGIVPLMLDKDIDHGLRLQLISLYKPRYLYLPETMADGFADCSAVYLNRGYVLLQSEATKAYQFDENLALLLTTSGSTGSSKFVRQSYRNLCSNAAAIAGYEELTASDRAVTTLPMNYTMGLSVIHSHLSVGASVLVTDRSVMEKEFLEFIKREEATSINGVPYTYEILKRLRFFRTELPAVRMIVCGGGKLSMELHREMAAYAERTGKQFIVRYGQTESTANMAYLPADRAMEKAGSMGIAIPGGRFALLNTEDKVITAAEETGELVYWGDNVAMGYAVCPEDLEKGDEWNGYLVTGDMAKRDEDGFYYIVGRKKRFLKIYGSRVNLDETERILHRQFPDMECACTGRDDEMTVYITIERRVEEVKKFLADITKLNIKAFRIRYIREIPRSNAGKIRYSALQTKEG